VSAPGDRERGAGAAADPLLAALSETARTIAAEDAGPGPTPAAWHRLQAMRARPARAGRGRWLLPAAALAAAAVFGGVKLAQRPRPLTYAVGDGAAEQDGYIRGGAAAGADVRFSDGTRVALARGARLSVLARGSDGARLRVEDGEAHFEVVHRPRAAWSVEAGPFVVYVTGTTFDVRWSGSDETVEVRLRAGSVRVGGPFLPERVTLRPGQRLTARLASGELRIDDERAGGSGTTTAAPAHGPAASAEGAGSGNGNETAAAPSAELPSPAAPAVPAVEAPGRAEAPSSRGSVRIAMPHRSRARVLAAKDARFAPGGWPAEVAVRGGDEVVAEAEAHGIERTLAEVDAGALKALADAARYGGNRDLAIRVLLAERERFPVTPPAQEAAFQLGRLADDRGDRQSALGWYRRYLAEAPRGPYAPDALGRAMLNVEKLSGRAAARDIAADYVRRFPNGTYLLQAHSILANP
jgi:hypothetical protein